MSNVLSDPDQKRYEELQSHAQSWLYHCFGDALRGNSRIQFSNGGTADLVDLLTDFAFHLPAREEIAALPRHDLDRLHRLAQGLIAHDPYRKALEDHMATCPGPPIYLPAWCPNCMKEIEHGKS